MLTEHLLFISWTPFIVSNIRSFAVSTLWLLFSPFGHPLCEWPSPHMTHLIFALQFLAECPKFWQLKHCRTEMGARNSSTLKIIPVCGHVMFLETIASASANYIWNIWSDLLSLLLFIRSALACWILLQSRIFLNSSLVNSVGTPFTTRVLLFL